MASAPDSAKFITERAIAWNRQTGLVQYNIAVYRLVDFTIIIKIFDIFMILGAYSKISKLDELNILHVTFDLQCFVVGNRYKYMYTQYAYFLCYISLPLPVLCE